MSQRHDLPLASGQHGGPHGRQLVGPTQPTNLADLLERVLDKGIVIAGDITVSLGQIELLTIKVRLLIASVDKAQEIGINWWQSDPALSSRAKVLQEERDQLRERLDRLEARLTAQAQEQGAGERALQEPRGRRRGVAVGSPPGAQHHSKSPGQRRL